MDAKASRLETFDPATGHRCPAQLRLYAPHSFRARKACCTTVNRGGKEGNPGQYTFSALE